MPINKSPQIVMLEKRSPLVKPSGLTMRHVAQRATGTGFESRSHDHEVVPEVVKDVLRAPGHPLDRVAQAEMGMRFGHDFSQVRVHADDQAAESAEAVGAKAYTAGHHVVFGRGFQPGSSGGRRLLMHELTHVVQQAGNPVALEGLRIGPAGGPFEAEAARGEAAGARPVVGLVQRDVLPVARFSPAPGLFLDRTDRSIAITGALELYGSEATAVRAASIQRSVNANWTRVFPDGYSVTCNVTVRFRGEGSSAGNATQIEAERIAGSSYVSGVATRSMTLNANDPNAFSWTAAHEFGHIIGLKDRYSESIWSSIKGRFGGQRTTTADPGYERNLMAVRGGALEGHNLEDLAEENEPSPYWINDDDQVRNWVNGHPLGDIGRISTAYKLRAIRTLMGGWISDDDVGAIARICSSVTSSAEANAIRSGIDLLNLSSIGQRTMVRVAFAKMP